METFGNLIDKLTICNLRIWMAEDIKRDINANDQQISHATRITNTCNQMRNDLIQEIDEKLNELVVSQTPQKLYGQGSTKLYGKLVTKNV